MAKKKTYTAHPEFIGRDIEIKKGHKTDELYNLERVMHNAIRKVIEWRRDVLDEKEWEEATPQTLRTILEGWDHNASKVAAKSYLSGAPETIEVER